MSESQIAISEVIRLVRQQFVDSGLAPSYYQINNGLCDEFATAVQRELGNPRSVSECCTEMFEADDGGWDWVYLQNECAVSPPEGLSVNEVDNIRFGGHVFLKHEHKWYDAECPDGADSFFDLPIFRRPMVVALRSKAMEADEVMPEDVRPAPLCKVPNPVKRSHREADGLSM